MQGERERIVSADGTSIGLLTGGAGPPLLLVHGGMTSLDRWAPLWAALTGKYLVTAMDRRGRGSSGDADGYRIDAEYADVRAVAEHLRRRAGTPVDVLGHSYGAVCVLGAAASGAPFRRVALYEPPGPQTVAGPWLVRAKAMVAEGNPGRAMASFLVEIIGLSREQVMAARDTPVANDAGRIVAATLPREGDALTTVDLPALATAVPQPVLLLLGETSPPWARTITHSLHRRLPRSDLAVLADQGHEAVDGAPELVADALHGFLAAP
jgi:pimeloyl-ACP methyl ester carboxylesterase